MYGSVYSYEVYSFLRRYGYRGIHDLGKCGYYSSSLTGLTLALVEASLVESSTLTVSPFAGSPLSVEATLVLLSPFLSTGLKGAGPAIALVETSLS